MSYSFNMNVLRPSNHQPDCGDVFCYNIIHDKYHYGRVIKNDARAFSSPDAMLLYFYTDYTELMTELPELSLTKLMIPPLMTDDQCWKKGFFAHVINIPLVESDILPLHCFYSSPHKKYFNEYWDELEVRTEPCGSMSLHTCMGVDKKLSKALGVWSIDSSQYSEYENLCGYAQWPSKILNDDFIQVNIRIKRSRIVDLNTRNSLELLLERSIEESVGKWYSSGCYDDHFHIDYEVSPGKYPVAHKVIMDKIMELGIAEFKVLVAVS